MAGEWRTIPAERFCSSVRDGTHDSPKPANRGRFLVTSRHIIGGQLDLASAYLISEADFDAINKRSKVDRWDVLVSMIGTVGELCLIKKEPDFAIKNIGLFKSKGETEGKWLYYYLRSPHAQQLIREQSRGTTQQYIPLGTLREFPIPIPDEEKEMRAIAHILGTLDDKIELNRRMNETLEAISRAIFKSWFVDFDPVHAKAEGRDPGLPKPIADLFPDSFEDSDLGEIPKGWEIKSFAATVEIIGGGTPKTNVLEYWDGEIPWFSVADAPRETDVWVVETEKSITQTGVENSSTRILPEGSTTISARGTVGKIALVGVPMAMNQSCYGLRGKVGRHGFFTYFGTRELVSSLKQRSHGSVFDTITRDTLAGVEVVVPPATLVEAFEQVVHPMLERIRANLFGCHALAALRDTLLPKLISGELRVKDAKRFSDRGVGRSVRSQRAGRERNS